MQKEFNTAIARFEVVYAAWGPEVHVHVLDGEDEEHVIIIDRPAAAQVFTEAGQAYLGNSELWEMAVDV